MIFYFLIHLLDRLVKTKKFKKIKKKIKINFIKNNFTKKYFKLKELKIIIQIKYHQIINNTNKILVKKNKIIYKIPNLIPTNKL
jgi:hypothetical protein